MQLESQPSVVPVSRCPMCGCCDRSLVLGGWGDAIALARCTACALVHATGRFEASFLNEGVYDHALPDVSPIQRDRKANALQRYNRLMHGRLLEAAAGSRVLDVGCNSGALLDQFQLHGFETEGIERSPGAARVARRNHEVHEVDVTMPGLDLGRSYDIITMSHVLEHIDRPAAALRFVDRHLAPGGVAIIEVPNWDDATRRLWGRRYRPLELGDHIAFYDPQTLARAIEGASLRIVHQWCGPQAAAHLMPNLLTAADVGVSLLRSRRSADSTVAAPRANAHAAPSALRRFVLTALDLLDPLLERVVGPASWGPNLIAIVGKEHLDAH